MPEFTVVIPARNEAKYLPTTLRALERQTRGPAQVIVVDNGSRDDTAAVARAWGAQVLPCPDRGVARARQLGLDAARTDWVATTDADSTPVPEWLERLDAAAPGRVGLYGPMRFSGVSPALVKLSEVSYSAFLHVCRVLDKPNLGGANMAYSRRAAQLAGGYPLDVEAYEDVILGQALARLGDVAYVPGALVETSGRRLDQGLGPFLMQQYRNITGRTRGYFGDDRVPEPAPGPAGDRPDPARDSG
ncbi:glycosyltransferase family 2 protein [Deinococcus ficus]|uniref:glycosyltransferase n=1 Tax=Deinococcus ficus TaxID=317577 RepID=UPI0003B3071D|nr:glycosyltransferase family 2 protein [Deinococcus ficus]